MRAEAPQRTQQCTIRRDVDEGQGEMAFNALRHTPGLPDTFVKQAQHLSGRLQKAAPAGVSDTLRLVRSNSGAPISCSSRRIAWLNGGCAM